MKKYGVLPLLLVLCAVFVGFAFVGGASAYSPEMTISESVNPWSLSDVPKALAEVLFGSANQYEIAGFLLSGIIIGIVVTVAAACRAPIELLFALAFLFTLIFAVIGWMNMIVAAVIIIMVAIMGASKLGQLFAGRD